MKPNWKDAPDWANYLAMDRDERWGWYENSPKAVANEWLHSTGRYDIANINEDTGGWDTTLEGRT